jgi:hypothetical protein
MTDHERELLLMIAKSIHALDWGLREADESRPDE